MHKIPLAMVWAFTRDFYVGNKLSPPPQLEERTGGFIKKRGLLENSGVKLNLINFKVCISNGAGVMPFRAKFHGSGILLVFVPPFLTKFVIFLKISQTFTYFWTFVRSKIYFEVFK
jgi:hypothetical protein